MSTRPPEPEFLIKWREWMRAGPPALPHLRPLQPVRPLPGVRHDAARGLRRHAGLPATSGSI